MTPGYWQSTYYPNLYWQSGFEYFPIFGLVALYRRGQSCFGFSMRDRWR